MKVKDLTPNSKIDELVVEIVSLSEARKFASEKGEGVVANAAVKDETGEVKMSFWNEQVKMIKEGDKIKIEGGWCSAYRGEKQAGTGKFGTLTVLGKDDSASAEGSDSGPDFEEEEKPKKKKK